MPSEHFFLRNSAIDISLNVNECVLRYTITVEGTKHFVVSFIWMETIGCGCDIDTGVGFPYGRETNKIPHEVKY